MSEVFEWFYLGLKWLANMTGFSYNEVNIIVYYGILPFAFLLPLDKLYKTHAFKSVYLLILIITILVVEHFEAFSNSLFTVSKTFLESFKSIGITYVQASVIICVVLPLLVMIFLWKKAYFSKTRDVKAYSQITSHHSL